MKFLVLQHHAAEHPGILRQFMDADGIGWDTVDLAAGAAIPPLEAYAAIISMGGPMDVWEEEKYPWLLAEKAAIRRAVVELRKPFLGICLGHQLLADALGGTVAAMPAPEVGIADVTFSAAARSAHLFAGLPATCTALHWHAAQVMQLPPDGVALASSSLCRIQAFRVGEFAYGMQYHIESTADTVVEWGAIPEYANALKQALGADALPRLDAEFKRIMPDLNRNARMVYDNFCRLSGNL